MKKILCVIFSIIVVSSWAKAADKINEKNWNDNSTIIAIRELYASIEDSMKKGDFARDEKNAKADGDTIDKIETYFDNDRIRKITETISSDKATSTSTECYYDSKGILRYIVLGDLYDRLDRNRKKESREFRLYFDDAGRLFWLISRMKGKDSYMKESIPKEDSFLEGVIRKYKDSQSFYYSVDEECPCTRKK